MYLTQPTQKEIDNPDQRIAEDINKSVDGFLSFFCDTLLSQLLFLTASLSK